MKIASRPPARRIHGIRKSLFARWFVAGLAACAVAPVAAEAAPTGMHYELVSPAAVSGTVSGPGAQSHDGSRVELKVGTGQGFGTTPSFSAYSNLFVASRTPSGWITSPLNPSAAPDTAFSTATGLSSDLLTGLGWTATPAQFHASQAQVQLTGVDGSVRSTLPVLTDLTNTQQDRKENNYMIRKAYGGSADLAHFVFGVAAETRLLPADGPSRGDLTNLRLYDIADVGTASATLRRVDVDGGGAEIGPECGAMLGGQTAGGGNAISSDGTRIFFSARPGATTSGIGCSTINPLKVYARVGGTQTIELSASECQRISPACSNGSGDAVYQSASADGSRVAFVSSGQLADSDLDSTADLYLYDFAKPLGHRLMQASVGDVTNATPGSGAAVKGLVQISEDGSRVYFIAGGVLTAHANAAGQTATPSANNLYFYEPATGDTSFVAKVNTADKLEVSDFVNQFAGLSDDAGDALVFSTTAKLLPADTDNARDVYRYDAASEALVQVSPADSPQDANIRSQWLSADPASGGARAISEDGKRVVFATADALVPQDVNSKSDVYLWEDGGTVQLVSDGQDPAGTGGGANDFAYAISEAGDQIAFRTTQRLVPEDVDDVASTYVARAGADIERLPTIDPVCHEDECQGERKPLPAVPDAGLPPDGGLGNLPVVDPSYRVPKLTTGQRTQLAKSGSTKLAVTISESGQVVATATGLINKGTATVASGKATATAGGVVNVTLKLTSGARRQLTADGKLMAKLAVTFSKVAPVQTQTVELTKAKPKAKAKKKSSKKRSSKRVSSKSTKHSGR